MPKENTGLTPAEWNVMECLWDEAPPHGDTDGGGAATGKRHVAQRDLTHHPAGYTAIEENPSRFCQTGRSSIEKREKSYCAINHIRVSLYRKFNPRLPKTVSGDFVL